MKFYESPELKRLAEETVKVCFEKACEYYGIVGKSVPSVKLKSDMKRVAGTANIMQNLITLNEILFKENVDEFVKEIIPHEVSHIIQRIVYPRAKQNHGPEFKRVMRNVFGLAGNTYHKMDCSNKELNIREKKVTRYEYKCECGKSLFLTAKRHQALLRYSNAFKHVCSRNKSGKLEFVRVIKDTISNLHDKG